ncbi:hypothetical protein RFF58_05990 [Streptococcus ruminantium]|nr:hypothetical protein [Streptococcus ruminantium]
MSKCKIASVAILAALSLFATASVSANEVVTVTYSPGTPFKNSDPCTAETVEQDVNRDNFVNIAAPGGRGTEGSEWVDEQVQKLGKSETVTVSVSSVVVPHRNSDPCTAETVEQDVNRDNFVNIAAPGGRGTEGSEWVDESSEKFNEIKKTVFIPYFFKFDFN